MGNGTIFHFVTEGLERAYELSNEVANGKDVRVGGGANTLRQFMAAGLLDEIHIVRVPVKLNYGELLFNDPTLELQRHRSLPPVVSHPVRHQTYVRK